MATCASWLTMFAVGPVVTDWRISESASFATRGLIVGVVVLLLAVLIAVATAAAEVREVARKPLVPERSPIRSKKGAPRRLEPLLHGLQPPYVDRRHAGGP